VEFTEFAVFAEDPQPYSKSKHVKAPPSMIETMDGKRTFRHVGEGRSSFFGNQRQFPFDASSPVNI